MNDKTILAKIKMIEMGIIPAFTGYELVSMLESLDRDSQRKAKRKFRKVWKKILKKDPSLRDSFVQKIKGDCPTKAMKRGRSVIVTSSIARSVKV